MNDETENIAARPAAGMAWAVEAVTRIPVYVGKLTRAQTGLRCGCICPACNAPLQAVNAGAGPGQRKATFFRHHVGQQGPSCKYRVAELAALQLLAEKGVIEIPAPRRRGIVSGVSGTLYQGEAIGSAIQERIVERRLLSEVGAILTLESGRQVALVLRGHQDIGELGSVFAIIQVQVDDPEVAWLSPEEILQRSELSSDWLHVVRHKEDEDLQSEADELARQKALEQLDIEPEMLGLPVGATRMQASESLVHWAVKDALMALGSLQAPELRLSVNAVGSTGRVHTVPVSLPSVRLAVAEVADEVLFDGYRADIVCRVRNEKDSHATAFLLLVEVAVTNKVKPEKLKLIRAAKMACMELDVMSFAQGGTVTRGELRDLVADDLESKVWLYHPSEDKLLATAQAKADAARDEDDAKRRKAEADETEQRIASEHRERQNRERAVAKVAWIKSLDSDAALRELRALLQLRWKRQPEYTSNAIAWQPGEFEQAASTLLPHGGIDGRLLAAGGLAWRLHAVISGGNRWNDPLDVKAVLNLDRDDYFPYELEPWLGLLHMAISYCDPVIRDGKERYEAQRELVFKSLEAGERRFMRPTDHDEALAGLFPELHELLTSEFGTRSYGERVRKEREAARLKADEELLLAEEMARKERARQLAEEEAEKERQRLPEAIRAVTYQWAWKLNPKLPPSAGAAVDYLRYSMHKDASQEMRTLVREAFAARQEGKEFASWFSALMFASAEKVVETREVLEAAWLIQSKLTV